MDYKVLEQMNSSGRQKFNVVDRDGRRVDQFDDDAPAQARAAELNAEYERVSAIL